MNIKEEINDMVKSASPLSGIKPITYFDKGNVGELVSDEFARRRFVDAKEKRNNGFRRFVNLSQGRQMPVFPGMKTSPENRGPSGVWGRYGYLGKSLAAKPNTSVASPGAKSVLPGQKRFEDLESTKMMARMNRRITADDAYAEIMRRRPGMNPEQARRLAPMVAKNYRVDAKGNWVALGGNAGKTNSMIANKLRGSSRPGQNAIASGQKKNPPSV